MERKNDILSIYAKEVEDIKEAGLFKGEAPIASAQGARVKLEDGREVINMCANNYLGLGDSQRLIDAAMIFLIFFIFIPPYCLSVSYRQPIR